MRWRGHCIGLSLLQPTQPSKLSHLSRCESLFSFMAKDCLLNGFIAELIMVSVGLESGEVQGE